MPQAYNTTDSPIVVDKDGRTIAGREHGDADEKLDGVQAALTAGTLIWDDDVPDADGKSSKSRSK